MNIKRNEIFNELCDCWEELNENLFYDNKFDLEKFKALFKNTWQYFFSAEPDNEKISLRDAELFGLMTPITWLNNYPEGATCSQFDACVCFVKGLCKSIVYPNYFYEQMKFWNGWITLPQNDGFHCGDDRHVYIDNFEKEFQDLKDEKSFRVYEMLKKLKSGQ